MLPVLARGREERAEQQNERDRAQSEYHGDLGGHAARSYWRRRTAAPMRSSLAVTAIRICALARFPVEVAGGDQDAPARPARGPASSSPSRWTPRGTGPRWSARSPTGRLQGGAERRAAGGVAGPLLLGVLVVVQGDGHRRLDRRRHQHAACLRTSSSRLISAGRPQNYGAKFEDDRAFALAAASLRQALQEMPDITELSKHIMVEETKQGLNIEIVDQDGRSMFTEGSKEPNDRTRRVIQRLAGPLKATGFRISISGHTSATRLPSQSNYGPWELSADRANVVRKLLETEGMPTSHFYMVAGKADTTPLFPDDPYIAANRRVTITLMREAPPIPAGFKP